MRAPGPDLVERRHCTQVRQIGGDGAAQRGELRLVDPLQPDIGAFQAMIAARTLPASCNCCAALSTPVRFRPASTWSRPATGPCTALRAKAAAAAKSPSGFRCERPFADLTHHVVGIARQQTGLAGVLAGFGQHARQLGFLVADALAAVEPRPDRDRYRQHGEQQGQQRHRRNGGARVGPGRRRGLREGGSDVSVMRCS